MSDAQKILQALQATIKGSSTQEIKNAQATMKSYETQDNFIEGIAMILEQSTVDANLQKSAAVYLNKHASNVVKSKNQQLINNTAQKILKLLANYKINIKHKIHIARALEFMILNDKSKIIRIAFQPNLLNILAQTEQQTDENINFQFLVFFGQILMNNPGFTQQVWKFISKSFHPFLKLTIRVQNLLEQVLLAKNGQLAAKLLFLTREYLYLLKIYLKRFLFVDIQSNKLLFQPEIQTVVTKALQIKLENNKLTYPIFHITPNPTPQQKILNQIKSNAITFLNNLIRILIGICKQPKLLQLNPTYKKTHQHYLPIIIESSIQLMKNHEYFHIKDLSVLNTLDEVYSLFRSTILANTFYGIFVQYKEKIIEDLIFRALVLTPNDYENYYQDPEEFINTLMHIIDRDVKVKLRKEPEEESNQIQTYATLRTNAAEFLSTFCKHQDGTLSQIMKYAFMILEGQVAFQFSPSLMLIIIAILRQASKQRRDLHLKTSNLILKLLTQMQIPKQSTQQPQSTNKNKELDIQYSLVLLLLCKNYQRIQSVNPKIIDFSFKLCHKLLTDKKVEEVPKLLAIDIIEVVNHLEEGESYSPDTLKTFNSLLKENQKPSQRLLEAYFTLLKYNDVILKRVCYKQLVQMINILAYLIQKQIQNPNREQIIINKLWNVIREVGENPEFIPLMIEPIENAIMPLLPYVDGNHNIDFQQDILMLMSAFIGKSHKVTSNQLKMFQIIPKIFYNQYKAIFGHSFQTMQTFIYYGKQILKTSPAAINSIIHMSLTSISSQVYKQRTLLQSDSCQGALLLQSLIITCGLSIQLQSYELIVQTVRKRLQSNTIKHPLLRSNLTALLALVLIHSCDNTSNDVNDILLSLVLNDIASFQNVKHSPKVLIIALNKLLLKYQFEFVSRRFTQILDTIITLLQMISMKKNHLFDDDDQSDEQRDYQNSLLQTTNDVVKMDEFQDFKNQIKVLKEQNITLIQSAVGELPQSKKDFLKNVLAVERVSNQPRKIFTIKRNK